MLFSCCLDPQPFQPLLALTHSTSLTRSPPHVPHSGVMFVFGGYQKASQFALSIRLFSSREPQGGTVRQYKYKY
jgi:hypothetical protein